MFPKREPRQPSEPNPPDKLKPHDCTCLVSNQTNSRLRLHGGDGNLLILSPLQRNKEVTPALSKLLGLEKQQQRGLVLLEHKQLWWIDKSASLKNLMGWARLKLSQLPLLVVGLGVPVLVILATNGFLGHLQTVHRALSDALNAQTQDVGVGQALVLQKLIDNLGLGLPAITQRFLQVTLIALLSLFPFQLFYVFDREHQETLRHRFTAQILRFDPSVKTRQDVMARYGKQLDEAYGPERHNGTTRIKPARLSPLWVASLVLSLGWTLTLLSPTGQPGAQQPDSLLEFFQPRAHPLTFGFLGAYFYALHTLFRSYARRDLQPKTYSNITTRVLGVMVLAWVLQESWKTLPVHPSESALNVMAFVAGITPETALLFIVERLCGALHGVKQLFLGANLVDSHEQLTRLQGIDLYDRARLQDEGVTNIEGLAHHDLIELMLQTRIPAARLLDWVDQAILYLHANVREQNDGSTQPLLNERAAKNARDDKKEVTLLERLRQYGIRNATDFEQAYDKVFMRKQARKMTVDPCLERLKNSGQLEVLRTVLKDEEWMINLRRWHCFTRDSETQDWCPSGRCDPDGTPHSKEAAHGNGATGPEAPAPRQSPPAAQGQLHLDAKRDPPRGAQTRA